MDVGGLRIVGNVESDEELVKPSSNQRSKHRTDDRNPEPLVVAVREHSPAVAHAQGE